MSERIRIVAVGLVGLIVAAALGYAALQMVSQPVGLSSVPAATGDDLAPKNLSEKPASPVDLGSDDHADDQSKHDSGHDNSKSGSDHHDDHDDSDDD